MWPRRSFALLLSLSFPASGITTEVVAYPRPKPPAAVCYEIVSPLFATRPFRIYDRPDRANAPANDRSIREERVRPK